MTPITVRLPSGTTFACIRPPERLPAGASILVRGVVVPAQAPLALSVALLDGVARWTSNIAAKNDALTVAIVEEEMAVAELHRRCAALERRR